jgi:hypothetical protein
MMLVISRFCKSDHVQQLVPSWKGSFEGHRPSLTGLRDAQVKSALETGIMTDAELGALMRLVQSPDVWHAAAMLVCH